MYKYRIIYTNSNVRLMLMLACSSVVFPLLFYFPVSCSSGMKILVLRALEMAFLINPNLNTVSNGVFF